MDTVSPRVTPLRRRCQYVHTYGKYVGNHCEKIQTESGFCKTHAGYANGQCNALVGQGPNKGNRCSRPCIEKENGYCRQHQTQAEISRIHAEGGTICRRHRCNNPVTTLGEHYCDTCNYAKRVERENILLCSAHIMQGPRKGDSCTNAAAKGRLYCDMHSTKEYLREYAKSIGKRVCGNGMRCNTLIPLSETLCEPCLEIRREADMKRYMERAADTTRCIDCGKRDILFASTKIGTTSRYCEDCYTKMRETEELRDRTVGIEGYKNPFLYYKRYEYDANRRGLPFALTLHEFISIVEKPCTYCGILLDMQYNGVDRQNNEIGYFLENCVSACSMCNCMKSSHSVVAFRNHCAAITLYHTEKICSESRLVWCGKNKTPYVTYKKHSADARSLAFELSEDEYYKLRLSPCYLCGHMASQDAQNGIDRIDSSVGYVAGNCAPCCVYCNRMKNAYSLLEFLEKCGRIRVHTS
jgi:hypothetical protein